MEVKKFTVVDTRTTTTRVFESNATTLGELKAELENMGISTEGMDIQEGLTRTELIDNTSILPHDVPYRGTTTNNLVFRLTKNNKMIKSGNITRSDIYKMIKDLGLEDDIKETFGKNFTNCSTESLKEYAEQHDNVPCRCSVKKESRMAVNEETLPLIVMTLAKAITMIANKMHDYDFFDKNDMNDIYNILTNNSDNGIYSKEEIENMFEGI